MDIHFIGLGNFRRITYDYNLHIWGLGLVLVTSVLPQ